MTILTNDHITLTPTTAFTGRTLTVAVTNQKLNRHALQQFGRQIHSSLARAIQPFHTLHDGDVLYALTTAEVENPALDDVSLGVIASELAWDAVLTSPPTADRS